MNLIASSHSHFEIDAELDALLDDVQEELEPRGEASKGLTDRLQQFCQAHDEKVDRLGRFVRVMEAREQFCRTEAARLTDRARAAANKADRTKSMVLYYLISRELRKVEGREFTLRMQKNSVDSVKIVDEAALPVACCQIDLRLDGVLWETVLSSLPEKLAETLQKSVRAKCPNGDAIRDAICGNVHVPGAEMHRGSHLRVI